MALGFPRKPAPCSAWPALFWPLFFAVVLWAHCAQSDQTSQKPPKSLARDLGMSAILAAPDLG